MLKNYLNVTNMKKCASLLVITCLFVCLTFNSTLPLHRNAAHEAHHNRSHKCYFIERTKNMASNVEENILRRIKDSAQNFGKNIHDHSNTGIKTLANKDAITEDDIRQYEELVIMKKYPYLDLKALEMKYGPISSKNTRQSATLTMEGIQNEPGIHCDAVEDLNVEIINRGLSGFAIPPLLAKNTESIDNKLIKNNIRKANNASEYKRFIIIPSNRDVIKSLNNDINAYIERKNVK